MNVIVISGHWIGDPCEFGHLSVNIIGKMYDRHDGYKHDYIDEETLAWGAVGGFGLTVAQAYNQGGCFTSTFYFLIAGTSMPIFHGTTEICYSYQKR